MMNLLLNTGNSTGLTGCPAFCACQGCLMSWPCLRIQWRSLQILWLRLQTKRSGYFKSSRPHRLGADQKTLLCLYRALVRYKLDYACSVYGAASNNILKKLDPIHKPRLTNCSRSFSYFSCNNPLCESTRDIFQKQTQETVYEPCFKTKNLSW